MVIIILLFFSLLFAALAAFNWQISPRVNLLGVAFALFILAQLWPHLV